MIVALHTLVRQKDNSRLELKNIATTINPFLRSSVITEHMMEYLHSFDWNNVKILDKESNYVKRSISKMLHIR